MGCSGRVVSAPRQISAMPLAWGLGRGLGIPQPQGGKSGQLPAVGVSAFAFQGTNAHAVLTVAGGGSGRGVACKAGEHTGHVAY